MKEFFYLLLFVLHFTEGCDLDQNTQTVEVTGHSGESVVLPCSCTELQAKPLQLTWTFTSLKHTTKPEEIYPNERSERHRGRVKLLNESSPGNLSLHISDLNTEDQGEYHCSVLHQPHINITLSVQGCDLSEHGKRKEVTGYTGGSVLLPCSCIYPQTTGKKFTWLLLNGSQRNEVFKNEIYKGRLKLFNESNPANLSLLISDLRKEDEGFYRCEISHINYADITVKIKGCDLDQNTQTVDVTGQSGESVVLPCSCTELQAKPLQLTWTFTSLKHTTKPEEIYPNERSERHRGRVKLLNESSPGNLSLHISDLNTEDQGEYHCSVLHQPHINITLSVQEEFYNFQSFCLSTHKPVKHTEESKTTQHSGDSIEKKTTQLT